MAMQNIKATGVTKIAKKKAKPFSDGPKPKKASVTGGKGNKFVYPSKVNVNPMAVKKTVKSMPKMKKMGSK
jgi:hypothetical protein